MDCIFCKIVEGNIPAVKIWEDSEHMAFLDINPNVEGMTLVIPKKHFDSYTFDMPLKDQFSLLEATNKVAKMLEKGLDVQRVAMVMEGLGVNHAHIKLYPVHGIDEKFKEMWAKDRVFFEKYQGYISTQLGHQKTTDELQNVADKIKRNAGVSSKR